MRLKPGKQAATRLARYAATRLDQGLWSAFKPSVEQVTECATGAFLRQMPVLPCPPKYFRACLKRFCPGFISRPRGLFSFCRHQPDAVNGGAIAVGLTLAQHGALVRTEHRG
jgi:hypothetical protein